MTDIVLHVFSIAASSTVFAVSALALMRMSRATAFLIQWSYISLFAGSGASTIVSAWELFTGGKNENAMHLSMLVVIAGLSILLLASRRRECLCPDCPIRRADGCGPCAKRSESR